MKRFREIEPKEGPFLGQELIITNRAARALLAHQRRDPYPSWELDENQDDLEPHPDDEPDETETDEVHPD